MRVDARRSIIGSSYDYPLRDFAEFVLDQYIAQGVEELDDQRLPELIKLKYRTVDDAIEKLGPASRIREMFIDLQKHLYETPPTPEHSRAVR